ncbi:MAG: transposase, partial [Candidatus Omnitrophica bacterium]|nr:transposase [Candidatus Omnitrophota bacterium]
MSYEEYNERAKSCKTMSDLNDLLKDLVGPTMQKMLEAEMSQHLGYEKHDPKGINSGNSRNGYSEKSVKTVHGKKSLQVPRDRNGSFEPIVLGKYETVDNDIEERIISMYARGMSTRDINAHMKEIYGVDVSSDMVSAITNKVLPLIQ